MRNARDILAQRVLLFDGGMGTYYKFDGTPVPCHTYLLTRDAWQARKDTL